MGTGAVERRTQVAPDAVGFAAALRNARLAAGLTQAELADFSGISLRSISDLERGFSTRPRRDTVAMLAEALGLDPAARAMFIALARGRRPSADAGTASQQPSEASPRLHGAFVGRDRLLAETIDALAAGDVPIVTLTGPGGVGKTRLAAEIARALPDRGIQDAGWLALESIGDPALLLPAADEVLRLPNRRSGGPRVLVLDNFEHLIAAAADLPDLVSRMPGLRLLVTSRAPLGIRSERVIPVPPLPGPDPDPDPDLDGAPTGDLDPASISPALELFIHRARAVRPDVRFDLIHPERSGAQDLADAAAICRSLDGLPLAIELAAGQLAAFSLPALRAWLEQSGPGALGSGGPDRAIRHRSMRDAFAWSHDLLNGPDRSLLRRLSVFSGGFTLSAVETVMADASRRLGEPQIDALPLRLAHLAAVNLLSPPSRNGDSGEPRFRMLELIRSFAQDHLDAYPEEAIALREAHHAWVRGLASRWRPGISRTRLNDWLDGLERERGNLRATLAWTTASGRAADALALAADVGRLWDLRDLQHEGMASLDAAVAAGEAAIPPVPIPPLAWYWIGTLAVPLDDPDRCREMGARLTAMAAETGDPAVAARGAILTSLWQSERGDHAAATATALAGLAVTDGADESLPNDLLVVRARLFNRLAVACHTEADAHGHGHDHAGPGEGACLAPLAVAEDAYRRALLLSEIVGDESGMLNSLAGLGIIETERGDAAAASANFRRGFALAVPNRHWWYCWLLMLGQSGALALAGDHAAAARLLGGADAMARARGFRDYAYWRTVRAGAESAARAALGDAGFAAACALGRRAINRAADTGDLLDLLLDFSDLHPPQTPTLAGT